MKKYQVTVEIEMPDNCFDCMDCSLPLPLCWELFDFEIIDKSTSARPKDCIKFFKNRKEKNLIGNPNER